MKKKPKKMCTHCGKTATRQTVKGKDSELAGGLPINDGWYCDKCWKEGEEIENEAMYGGSNNN